MRFLSQLPRVLTRAVHPGHSRDSSQVHQTLSACSHGRFFSIPPRRGLKVPGTEVAASIASGPTTFGSGCIIIFLEGGHFPS